MNYEDSSIDISFLCYHGGKQRNRDIHGGELMGVGSDGTIRMI